MQTVQVNWGGKRRLFLKFALGGVLGIYDPHSEDNKKAILGFDFIQV